MLLVKCIFGLTFLLRNCDVFGYTVNVGFESGIDPEEYHSVYTC